MKRSYWSFLLLVFIYFIGLGANLLCNNLPIYLHFEGKHYFPIFRYYPEEEFLNNGRLTRPNYKKLTESGAFKSNPSNIVYFPLFPYGPNESLSEESIDIPELVTVEIESIQRVGTVNIHSDYRISRSNGSAYFFGKTQEDSLRRMNLKNHWKLTPDIEEAVYNRFENRNMPSVSIDTVSRTGQHATLSISAYQSRTRKPSTVRIIFRELINSSRTSVIKFNPMLQAISEIPGEWHALNEVQKTIILENVKTRFKNQVSSIFVEIIDQQYLVNFLKEDLYFPYRPNQNHIMGLDSSGRDVFVRIVYALRTSLNFGFLLVCSTMALGIIFGSLQGYFGGKIDLFGQRLIEIWESLPFIYVLILIGSIYGRSFIILLLIYGIFNWIGISYYMRAEFFRLRKLPFVESALCLGLSNFKIIFRHILPNGLVPIITFFPFYLVGAIGLLAALDFLGFGMPPPTPSWGELLGQAQEFRYAWWLILYPSSALFVVVLLGVFIGEGARSALDPRTNNHLE
tara:strand:+ start:38700 stop:40235 length:1536 start_codon:yes stop_codon:yes gene_type:complete